MAATLVLIVAGIYSGNSVLFIIAAAVLLVNMIIPRIYIPLGFLWFGLSNILGAFVSRVILSIIFFAVVTPVGLLRKAGRKDNLRLTSFKKNNHPLYIERNHMYTKSDIEKPF